MRVALSVLVLLSLASCGNPAVSESPKVKATTSVKRGEPVRPPFALRGELEGLLLVWFDGKGAAHVAGKRSDVPEASRARVRVDALELKPEQRLDPNWVYVADLRGPGQDGDYRVEKWARETFESSLLPPPAPPPAKVGADQVILYGASWCGACKQAARFLSQRGVPFVEKDIEKEPAAREELMQKARAQGVSTQSIPVIDVRGTLMAGFDPERLGSLLERTSPSAPADQGS